MAFFGLREILKLNEYLKDVKFSNWYKKWKCDEYWKRKNYGNNHVNYSIARCKTIRIQTRRETGYCNVGRFSRPIREKLQIVIARLVHFRCSNCLSYTSLSLLQKLQNLSWCHRPPLQTHPKAVFNGLVVQTTRGVTVDPKTSQIDMEWVYKSDRFRSSKGFSALMTWRRSVKICENLPSGICV